jgi:hypothetical protein
LVTNEVWGSKLEKVWGDEGEAGQKTKKNGNDAVFSHGAIVVSMERGHGWVMGMIRWRGSDLKLGLEVGGGDR